MTINVIGSCDKRPVIYTLMKICQGLGDVLLITSNTRLKRLSDTGESFGHCQNTMIAIAEDGIDEFWENFSYDVMDFEFIIIDNIVSGEADLTIYVKGMVESENDLDILDFIESYETIELYANKLLGPNAIMLCEEFEALKDFTTISDNLATVVAKIMATALNASAKNLEGIAKKKTTVRMSKVPTVKKQKGSLFGRK